MRDQSNMRLGLAFTTGTSTICKSFSPLPPPHADSRCVCTREVDQARAESSGGLAVEKPDYFPKRRIQIGLPKVCGQKDGPDFEGMIGKAASFGMAALQSELVHDMER